MEVKSDPDELLLPQEAGRLLGVGPTRVRQLESAGILKAVRTASGWRLFRRGDVEQLAAERGHTTGTASA